MSECPVCYAETKCQTIYGDYVIVEDYEDCPYKCYGYEFTYGRNLVYFRIRGQVIVFHWSYDSTGQENRDRDDAINIVTLAARKALIEDLRKSNENNQAES